VWQGDSHAAQGNREVNLTGLENAFQEITLTITGGKTTKLEGPRIETGTQGNTAGVDEGPTKPPANAQAGTPEILVEQRKVSAEQAASMVSKTSDCRVTQVVDIKKGVHCMTSKDLAKSLAETRPTAETPQYLVTYAADANMNKAMDDASWAM